MPAIEGFRIKNYKSLRSVELGRFYNSDRTQKALTPLTAVIGKNGAGKSSLFDAFGFLADCLKLGVEDACNQKSRGGFDKIHSQGIEGPIEFEIYFNFQEKQVSPLTYQLAVNKDEYGRVFVEQEILRQRQNPNGRGFPLSVLHLANGKGIAYKGETGGEKIEDNRSGLEKALAKKESRNREIVELADNRKLGVAELGGSAKVHQRIAKFRKFIEGWYLSYFSPDASRELPLAGPQRHLDIRGENLSNVVQFMEREHPHTFNGILERIAGKIPGIDKITTKISPDSRLLLQFNDRGFTDPFYSQQMSDGTLKMFSYMMLLEDPAPPPFLCIEEPENGLYHKLLEILAAEFREHANKQNGSQIFITTHQPYFVNALVPDEVWILEKNDDGFSTIRRASNDETVIHLVEQDLPLGDLWYSDYLERRP
jgi:predicted ATPase